MRSFMGRDILSLKDFERQEFFRVFEIAKQLEPIARNRRNSNLLAEKTLGNRFLSAQHPHTPGARSRDAPSWWSRNRFFRCENDPRR